MKYIEIYTRIDGTVETGVYDTKKEILEAFEQTKHFSDLFKESSIIELKPDGETSLLAHWEK